MLKAYSKIARVLSASNQIEDKKLAVQIVDFVKALLPLKTLHQQAVESGQLQKMTKDFEKSVSRDSSLELNRKSIQLNK